MLAPPEQPNETEGQSTSTEMTQSSFDYGFYLYNEFAAPSGFHDPTLYGSAQSPAVFHAQNVPTYPLAMSHNTLREMARHQSLRPESPTPIPPRAQEPDSYVSKTFPGPYHLRLQGSGNTAQSNIVNMRP